MGGITVQVLASHPVAAAQYARVLAAQEDLRLVAEEERAQVGVFDGDPASLDAALERVGFRAPSLRPLILWPSSTEDDCLRWTRRGAWGLVAYDRYEEDLPLAVRSVAEGQLWFPATLIVRWMRDQAALRAAALRFPLTPREHDVMELLLRGGPSNKDIAARLRISERTVKFHVGNILSKLHVSSRRELPTAFVPRFDLAWDPPATCTRSAAP